jgi:hypothetical protein
MYRGINIAVVRGHYGVNDSTINFVKKNADKISSISSPLKAKISSVILRYFLHEKMERASCMAGG